MKNTPNARAHYVPVAIVCKEALLPNRFMFNMPV